jgi:hypothetical protein
MPEVQNFNYLGTLLNTIVDENRCMDELTDTLFSGHGASDIGKSLSKARWFRSALPKFSALAAKFIQEYSSNLLEID